LGPILFILNKGYAIVEYLDYQIPDAIVKYLDYQIPVTQLKGPKGNGDMKQQSGIKMRHLPAVYRL